MGDTFIYRSNGQYLGFVRNNILYAVNGVYLGYQDGIYFWNSQGQFCGQLYVIGAYSYILKYQFNIPANPQPPKYNPNLTEGIPAMQPQTPAVLLNAGFKDGF